MCQVDTAVGAVNTAAKKTGRRTLALNDTLGPIELIGTYRTFHSKTTDHIFFSSIHRTFSRIDHMLCQKKVSINLRRLKSYQATFWPQWYKTRNQLHEKTAKKTQKHGV